MCINLTTYSQKLVSFGEKISLSLTPRQLKIIAIASFIFGCLSFCFAIYQHLSLKKLLKNPVKMTTSSGTKIDLFLKQGLLEKVKIEENNGDLWEGEYTQGTKPYNGKGKYFYDTMTFEGVFEKGNLVEGTMINKNGIIYKGKFDYSSSDAYLVGKIIYSSDNEAEGTFDNNLQIQKGKWRFPLGSLEGIEMEGEFFNNAVKLGKISYPDGIVEFVDVFHNDFKVRHPNGSIEKLKGWSDLRITKLKTHLT